MGAVVRNEDPPHVDPPPVPTLPSPPPDAPPSRRLMDDERWSFFYATEIFVVRRYDLQTIREAVYGRIKEVHDQVALDAEGPPTIG